MLAASVGLTVLLCAGTAPGAVDSLRSGIELYEDGEYSKSLQALTDALYEPRGRRERALIHLYIGLIQHRYQAVNDARVSFTKSIEAHDGIGLPPYATPGARALFLEVREALIPDEAVEEDTEAIEDDTPPRRAPARVRRRQRTTKRTHGSARKQARAKSTASPEETKTSTITLAAIGPNPSRTLTEISSSAAATPGPASSTRRIGMWSAAGAGAVAITVGVVLGILARNTSQEASQQEYAARAESLHGTAVTEQAASIVSFGVAGVSLGVAAYFFFGEP